MAVELERAREHALATQPVVTRHYVIGWEMHHGYFLAPIDNLQDYVTPDFLDKDIIRQFDDFTQLGRAFPAGTVHPHLGKRLICECSGVEWTFYSGKRFIVQSVILEAQ